MQFWLARAQDLPLDLVDWSDHPSIAHVVARDIEQQILALRKHLKEQSDLGEYGAEAIHREMYKRDMSNIPSIRTINRILERNGAFDSRQRVRRQAPPLGWYLPGVADGEAELDLCDVVSGLVIEGGIDVEVLNIISLHGGLVSSWPIETATAQFAVDALIERWRMFGCPTYAQFDNDTRFQGAHQFADSIGRVTRLCLSLRITPVFTPTRETGFQAAIESYNNRWQQKVWQRFHHESLQALQACSERYVAAARQKGAQRQDRAPQRHAIPENWSLDLQVLPSGQVVFLRRTDEHGQVNLLGHIFKVDEHWLHRLVRAEVHLPDGPVRFYSLRRRDPGAQVLIGETPYHLPRKRFIG